MKIQSKWIWPFLLIAGMSAGAAPETTKVEGPILEGLGTLHFPITTSSQLAQRYFNQGLTLSYAFNHKEAIRSFKSVAALDPQCAMAYWGVAYANGPHVNKPMTEEENKEAWSALQQALALATNASAKQSAMIQALSKRYAATFAEDRSALDRSYASAMRELVKEYPDDLDIQTMFAEALMDTMPWDYWLKDRSPKPETDEALKALKLVMARDPDHPGANHFFIHLVEAGPQPELGLPAADRLLKFAPSAGHLVHMPSHIYMRVGQFSYAVNANELAVEADKEYLRQSQAQGFYPGVYYPHNIHFLWWALMYEGRSKDSLARAEEAARYAVENYCGPNKALEAPRFRHLPALTLMRFGRWDEVLKIPAPAMTNDFLIDRALWHFTRGIAMTARNNVRGAAVEHYELAKLTRSESAAKLDNPLLPVTSILAVADRWLAARVAEAQDDNETMIKRFEEAIAQEDALPYMEPAYWPINVRPAFGAALLRARMPEKAEKIFREDLDRIPRNAWGLLGLEQALRAQKRNEAADAVKTQFQQSWKNSDTDLHLSWF